MGESRERTGKVALFLASSAFRTALYICVILAFLWVGKTAYSLGYQVFGQESLSPNEGHEITVVIPHGSSNMEIAKILKRNKVIGNSLVFYLQEKLLNYDGKLQPGEYKLSDSYKPGHIMEILSGQEKKAAEEEE